MRALSRRDLRDDQGSLILALLGIVILTTVASVGLVAVVNGQGQSRHDNRFAQALNNAESGIDAMVAKIKATDALNSPSQALSQSPTLNQTGVYQVTASPQNNVDETGAAASTTWLIKSIGTATLAGGKVTRVIWQTVSITHDYTTPVLGTNNLALPSGSKITTYTRGDGDATCGETIGTTVETTCNSQQIASGVVLPLGLGTLGSTTITNIPSGGSPGPAQTGGTLDVQSNDLSNFSQIQLDGTSAQCATTNTAPCSTSTIVTDTDPPPTIQTPGCLSGWGSGAALKVGGVPVGVVVPTGNLIFNANLQTNFYQNPPVNAVFCTNLPVIIPTLGADLNGILGLTGASQLTGLQAAVDIPLGANCGTQNLAAVITANLTCTMNNPSSLVINQMGTATTYIGTGGSVPTYVSALIASPGGTCNINGNVVLYGAINCKSITYTAGSSLTVYYPTDAGLGFDNTKHRDSVADWNECDIGVETCKLSTT